MVRFIYTRPMDSIIVMPEMKEVDTGCIKKSRTPMQSTILLGSI
jgi:hypothetical protein